MRNSIGSMTFCCSIHLIVSAAAAASASSSSSSFRAGKSNGSFWTEKQTFEHVVCSKMSHKAFSTLASLSPQLLEVQLENGAVYAGQWLGESQPNFLVGSLAVTFFFQLTPIARKRVREGHGCSWFFSCHFVVERGSFFSDTSRKKLRRSAMVMAASVGG